MNEPDKAAGKSSLEDAIRDKAASAIAEIARKEAEEEKELEEAYAAEFEAFRKQMEARTDDKIARELSRVENRASLELKKLKLKRAEDFITRTVEEVLKGIRDNPQYKSFLLDTVRDAIGRIPTGAEIRLKGEDFVYETELCNAINKAGGKDVRIVRDETIKWGGCIIIDVTGGRIFDGTIERAKYRNLPVIRREFMRILGNPPGK